MIFCSCFLVSSQIMTNLVRFSDGWKSAKNVVSSVSIYRRGSVSNSLELEKWMSRELSLVVLVKVAISSPTSFSSYSTQLSEFSMVASASIFWAISGYTGRSLVKISMKVWMSRVTFVLMNSMFFSRALTIFYSQN